jgi:hypothetical protein
MYYNGIYITQRIPEDITIYNTREDTWKPPS